MSSSYSEAKSPPLQQAPRTTFSTRHALGALLLPFAALALLVRAGLPVTTLNAHLRPHTSPAAAKIDWSWLAPEKQCPGVQPIGGGEFTERRSKLAELLKGEDGAGWGAYVAEPG